MKEITYLPIVLPLAIIFFAADSIVTVAAHARIIDFLLPYWCVLYTLGFTVIPLFFTTLLLMLESLIWHGRLAFALLYLAPAALTIHLLEHTTHWRVLIASGGFLSAILIEQYVLTPLWHGYIPTVRTILTYGSASTLLLILLLGIMQYGQARQSLGNRSR